MKQVPALHPCPTCTLPVQTGDGPFELAWHDCAWVQEVAGAEREPGPEATLDGTIAKLLPMVLAKMATASPRDAASIINALSELKAASGVGDAPASSKPLLQFLSG